MTHDQLIEDALNGCATGDAADAAVRPVAHADDSARFPLLTDAIDVSSVSLFEENLRRGAKPAAEWMCGIEFELFGYDARDSTDPARLNPAQVQRVLTGFAPSSDDLVYEGRTVVEANAGQMNRLTVEPGGQ
ncbi:MAG: hypothetical protein QOD32_368, partial [Pyrinomonadaceae bacterium]|nr:hypothetical protein [Pyrinomonadaceae bacterium]